MAGWLPFIGDLIGETVNGLSNLFTNKSNEKNVSATNAANLQIARETNALNQQLNQENIAFQQAENDITRQREDNAVQRRAADLVAAGLSKTLAAGSAASANALQAPRNTFSMEKSAPMQAFQRKAFKLQNEQLGTAILENQVRQKELKYKDAEISNLNKRTEWYGYPDWYVALSDFFSLDELKEYARKLGDNVMDFFFPSGSSGSSGSSSSATDSSGNVRALDMTSFGGTGLNAANGLPAASDSGYRIDNLPNGDWEAMNDNFHRFMRHPTDYFEIRDDGMAYYTDDGVKYAKRLARAFNLPVEVGDMIVRSWIKRYIDAHRHEGAASLGGGYAW